MILRGSAARHAQVYQSATTAPPGTLTGTYGLGKVPLRGCIGLHLSLYSIHSTATDRRWAMSHSNTLLAPTQARSSSFVGVYRQPSTTCWTVLQNFQDKTQNASQNIEVENTSKLLFLDLLGRTRRSYAMIREIMIRKISSGICENRCKYLWGIDWKLLFNT